MVNRVLKKRGLQLIRQPDDYQWPEDLTEEFFNQPVSCLGIDFREQEQWSHIESRILPRRQEFAQWPLQSADNNDYILANEFFGPVDAEVYYSMIDKFRPNRIVEIGGGNSTRLARKAIAELGLSTRLICIDPNPRAAVASIADEHIVRNVQSVSIDFFRRLQSNDIFFIDSSHRIEIGGDLPFLYLEILPRLAPGVLVHIHDIHLPRQYPQAWIREQERLYDEQYAVALMLANNNSWRVLWATQWMMARDRQRVETAFGNIGRLRKQFPNNRYIPAFPGSLWISKVG